jgi:L-seryl-tRNA(Ser) seleniumtransferase
VAIDAARGRVRDGHEPPSLAALVSRTATLARRLAAPAYPAVLNATGVLIHTNLGRAPRLDLPLPPYLALEYDLATGQRGERLGPVVERLTQYFGTEAATVCNNNAAALVLLLAAHAPGREVIVSRGELVEIGGSFRLPEIMRSAGTLLVEVGCTNRTHAADYGRAVSDATAAILVVHRSNFHQVGFVATPALEELVALAHRHSLPLWVDEGSGCHLDLVRYGLRRATTVQEIAAAGADAVLFSGDKLLGSAQAGIIVGRSSTVAPLREHPLRRALRPDKASLVTLAATLDAYLAGRPEAVPLYGLLATSEDELQRRARRLARRLSSAGIEVAVCRSSAVLGGGTTPDQTLRSWALGLPGGERAAALLRASQPAVIARVESDLAMVDLRGIAPTDDHHLLGALLDSLSDHPGPDPRGGNEAPISGS